MTRELCARELEILELIAQGYEYRDTAGKMFLSITSVKRYMSRAILKLGALNGTHAVVLALEKGIIRFPDGSSRRVG